MSAALVYLAIACCVSMALAAMLAHLVKDNNDFWTLWVTVAVISGLAMVGCLIASGSLVRVHFDHHCHALHGVLHGDDCLRPHSVINA